MAFNAYALRRIEGAAFADSSQLDTAILRTFDNSLSSFSTAIASILVDATAASSSLTLLEEHLTTAHLLCLQEAVDNTVALDELLWELWTRLGGNRQKVRDLKNREVVLKKVEHYRSVAVAYVAHATHTLMAVDVELSELRDRLSSSVLKVEVVPIEVQLASIQASVYRMKEVSGNYHSETGSDKIRRIGNET